MLSAHEAAKETYDAAKHRADNLAGHREALEQEAQAFCFEAFVERSDRAATEPERE